MLSWCKAPSLFLLSALLLTRSAAGPFSDIQKGNICFEAAAYLASEGFITGPGDGAFHPEDTITAAEYLTLLYRVSSFYGICSGHDTTGQNWQQAAGFLAGRMGLGLTVPDEPLTRDRFSFFTAAFLCLSEDYHRKIYLRRPYTPFADTHLSTYPEELGFLQSVGAVPGWGDTGNKHLFFPSEPVSRGEALLTTLNILQNLILV